MSSESSLGHVAAGRSTIAIWRTISALTLVMPLACWAGCSDTSGTQLQGGSGDPAAPDGEIVDVDASTAHDTATSRDGSATHDSSSDAAATSDASCGVTVSDASNCGSCGHVCPSNKPGNEHGVCAASQCAFDCDFGFVRVNGKCAVSQATWHIVPGTPAENYEVVTGASASDFWILGADPTTPANTARTLRWNGTQFKSVNTFPVNPQPGGTYGDGHAWTAWASATSDIWITRNFGTLQHGDGTNWTYNQMQGPSGQPYIFSIWGSSPSDVWMGYGPADNTMMHWNGSKWAPVSTGLQVIGPQARRGDTTSLSGSSASNVWAAVSANGASDEGIPDFGAVIRWNGSAWSTIFSDKILARVLWTTGPNDTWITGPNGTMLHWNGTTTSPVAMPANSRISKFWGTSANNIWAAGFAGTLFHWDGSAWSKVASGTKQNIYGIWGTSADNIWAVGAGGTILHYAP